MPADNAFSTRLAAPTTARHAILAALTATGQPLTTAQLRLCGALFGIEAAALRVALGRLVASGHVKTRERGSYEIGAQGRAVADTIGRWRDLPELVRPWSKTWVVVHTAHLGRRRRPQLRKREQALALFGFAALSDGLWVRPDNLTIAPDALCERLTELGLEPGAIIATQAHIAQSLPLEPLWDRTTLESGYAEAHAAMRGCLDCFESLSVESRARDTARIGRAVVDVLVFDPLLPRGFVDVELRDAVYRLMLKFDRVGKQALNRYWTRAAAAHTEAPAPS